MPACVTFLRDVPTSKKDKMDNRPYEFGWRSVLVSVCPETTDLISSIFYHHRSIGFQFYHLSVALIVTCRIPSWAHRWLVTVIHTPHVSSSPLIMWCRNPSMTFCHHAPWSDVNKRKPHSHSYCSHCMISISTLTHFFFPSIDTRFTCPKFNPTSQNRVD